MKNSNNLSLVQKTVVGAQFLFVAFGATGRWLLRRS